MPEDRLDLWHPPTTVQPSQLHIQHPPGYTYKDPIPTFTTQTPGELLDDYYIDRPIPEWTDPREVGRKQLEVYLNRSHNTVGSIGSSGLAGRPRGLAAEPVPVPWNMICPVLDIEFRNLNRKCPSAGVPLADFYVPNPDALAGAGDIVFHGSKRPDMKFLISWPGYQFTNYMIGTAAAHGGHLCRFELGQRVAQAYAWFFQNVKEEGLLPIDVGFYNISLDQDSAGSTSESSGVQLLQLHLVRVRGRVGGTWIAEVDIV